MQLPSKTILVVDDNEQVCSLIERVLSRAGYNVLQAHDAAEALAMLPTIPHLELLVTDVIMPGLSGFDLASHVIAARNVPVLFVSGCTQPSDDIPGPVLQKPFTAEALLQLVERLLTLAGSPTLRLT